MKVYPSFNNTQTYLPKNICKEKQTEVFKSKNVNFCGLYSTKGLWKIFGIVNPNNKTSQEITKNIVWIRKALVSAEIFNEKMQNKIKNILQKNEINLYESELEEIFSKYEYGTIMQTIKMTKIFKDIQRFNFYISFPLFLKKYSENKGNLNRLLDYFKMQAEYYQLPKEDHVNFIFSRPSNGWADMVNKGLDKPYFEMFKKYGFADDKKIAQLRNELLEQIPFNFINQGKELNNEVNRRTSLYSEIFNLIISDNFTVKNTSENVKYKNDKIKSRYIQFLLKHFEDKYMTRLDFNKIISTPISEIREAEYFMESLSQEAKARWQFRHAILFQKYKNYNSLEQLTLDMKNQLKLDLIEATDWTIGKEYSKEIKILPKNIDEWVKIVDYLKKEVQPVSRILSSEESLKNNVLFENIINKENKILEIQELINKSGISKTSEAVIEDITKIIINPEFKTLPDSDKKVLILAALLSKLNESPLALTHRVKDFELSAEDFQKLYSILKNQKIHQKIEKILNSTPKEELQICLGASKNPIDSKLNTLISELIQPNTFKMSIMLSNLTNNKTSPQVKEIINKIDDVINKSLFTSPKTHLEYSVSQIKNVRGTDLEIVKYSDLKNFYGFTHATFYEAGTSGGYEYCANPIFGTNLDNKMKVKLIDAFETITHNNLISVASANNLDWSSGTKFLINASDGNILCNYTNLRRINKKDLINNVDLINTPIQVSANKIGYKTSGGMDGEVLISNPTIVAILTDNLENLADEYIKIARDKRIPVILTNK